MSVGISVTAGSTSTSSGGVCSGHRRARARRGASDVPSASASETWTSSREKASFFLLDADQARGERRRRRVLRAGRRRAGRRGPRRARRRRLSGLGDCSAAGFRAGTRPRGAGCEERAGALRRGAQRGRAGRFIRLEHDDDASERDEEAGVDGLLPLAGRLGSGRLGATTPSVSRARAPWGRPVLENARHDLTRPSSRGIAPRAFRKPRVGVKRDWSAAYTQALSLAEQVYVLCVCGDATFVVRLLV